MHECDERTFETVMEKLGAKGVGKSFFVYKYEGVDIALPRTESKIAKGHRGFDVKLARDAKTACSRRDFTVNALLYDMQTEQVIDYFGGLEDLRAKRLRIVDPSTFADDSLRVLRAMQFSARLGFRIDPHSSALMRKMDLSDLSDQRIFNEFEKMFYATNLHYGLYYLLHLKIAQKVLGQTLTRKKFLSYAKALSRDFAPMHYPYIFAYLLRRDLDFRRLKTLPKHYRICYDQPLLPKNVTRRYVAAVATKIPIREFLGNYSKKVIQYAKELQLMDSTFAAVTPRKLIARGFRGKAIGKQLRKENLHALRKIDL